MAFAVLFADVSMENFSHNNMIPFFGSGIRQNLDENMNQTLLEKYTGYDDSTRIEKMEQPNFADINPNVFMDQNSDSYLTEYERMEAPKGSQQRATGRTGTGRSWNEGHRPGSRHRWFPTGRFQRNPILQRRKRVAREDQS